MTESSVKPSIGLGRIEGNLEMTMLLGVFVTRWSLAEFSLMLALMTALQSARQELATTILASTTSAEAKISLVLKALMASQLPDDRRDNIRAAVKNLGSLCAERNALMHHAWGTRSTGEIITINYRELEPARSQTVRTPASMKALCNAVVDAAYQISQSTGSIWIDAAGVELLRV